MRTPTTVLRGARTLSLAAARRVAARDPRLVRGALRAVVLADLGRRLAGGSTRRAARREALRLLAHGDRRVAAGVAALLRRDDAADALEPLAAAHAEHPSDGPLALELAAAARATDHADRARQALARALGAAAPAAPPAALVHEALLQRDAVLLARARHLAAAADGRAARAAVSLADDLADLVTERGDLGPAILGRLGGSGVAALAAGWLDGDAPASSWLAVGRALLADADVDVDAARTTARALRAAGDFSVSTALAQRVAAGRGVDLGLGGTARTGAVNLRTLRDGWAPPERRARRHAPRPHAVEHVLHTSLPHSSVGYATRTHGLLLALRERGWDVAATTRPGFPYDSLPDDAADVAPADEVDGLTYRRLLDGRTRFPAWPVDAVAATGARLLAPVLEASRPGLVHAASNFRVGAAAVAAAREAGLPCVYEVRGLWEYTRSAREPEFADSELFALTARLEADVCRAADRVLVLTAALGERLVERGVDPSSVVVVPNGVDVERFTPRPRDEALAAELGLAGRTVVGYVGTLLEYEGLDVLVEATALLAAERDDLAVLVVGDGRSLPALRDAVERAGLGGTVVFTGRVPHDDVERYLSLVDVAPFPRLGVEVCELVSPLKPFEAMAMRKPVVVSDVAALTEVVTDGVTGLVVEKGSAASLAAALRRLLDDPALRERLADAGHRWVRAERSWSAIAGTVDAVYADLWAQHHPDVPLG